MSLKKTNCHINKFKVRYSEIDCQKIVYNSHYLTYFDISISEMMDELFDQEEYIKQTNNEFHTVNANMNFKSPAVLNDKIEVYTAIKRIGKSSLTFIAEIYRENSDEILNEGEITWVNTNQEKMKSSPIPEELKEKFNKYQIS